MSSECSAVARSCEGPNSSLCLRRTYLYQLFKFHSPGVHPFLIPPPPVQWKHRSGWKSRYLPPVGLMQVNYLGIFLERLSKKNENEPIWTVSTPKYEHRTFKITLRYSRKAAGSFRDWVIGIFYWRNPSGHTMVLRSTQPLTDVNTRDVSWGVKATGA